MKLLNRGIIGLLVLTIALSILATLEAGQAAHAQTRVQSTMGQTLVIKNFVFSKLTVKPGERFIVKNQDFTDHTFKIANTKVDSLVHARSLVIITAPTKVGIYTLTCDFHAMMKGSLVVKK